MGRQVCAALAMAGLLASGLAPASAQSGNAGGIWNGVYTAEQAVRGQRIYGAECAGCHLESLRGDGGLSPSLAGSDFLQEWQKRSLNDLFLRIRTTMPANSPASLSDQAYADLVAFMLQVNKLPEGPQELKPDEDVLKTLIIRIEKP